MMIDGKDFDTRVWLAAVSLSRFVKHKLIIIL